MTQVARRKPEAMSCWSFLRRVFGAGVTHATGTNGGCSFMVLAFDPDQGGWMGERCRGQMSAPTPRLLQAVEVLL